MHDGSSDVGVAMSLDAQDHLADLVVCGKHPHHMGAVKVLEDLQGAKEASDMLWPPPPLPPVVRAPPGDEDLAPLEVTQAECEPLITKLRMCPTGETGEVRVRAEDVDTSSRGSPACLHMRRCVEGGYQQPFPKKKLRGRCTDHRITS